MCDSPTGLLVFALKGLRLLAPRLPFTPEQIITFTNLAWLPGPEYAMRFWAHCATHDKTRSDTPKKQATRPRVGITVFLGETGADAGTGERAVAAQDANDRTIQLEAPTKTDASTGYVCPAWANTHYSVLFSQRARGLPGLLAWERPHVILTGLRGLAKEILRVDRRLQAAPVEEEEANTVPLEGVVSPGAEDQGEGGLAPPPRPLLEQGDSSRTQVASQPPSSPKGKEPEMASPLTAEEGKGRDLVTPEMDEEEDRSIREGTPDTVVLVTAPKEDAAK